MKLEVCVTDDDIKQGRAGEYNCCPVALALKRLGCTEINVDIKVTKVTLNALKYTYKTPRIVDLFIMDFDDNRTVKPINFILEQPTIK